MCGFRCVRNVHFHGGEAVPAHDEGRCEALPHVKEVKSHRFISYLNISLQFESKIESNLFAFVLYSINCFLYMIPIVAECSVMPF